MVYEQILFWITLILLAYTYLGYPILIWTRTSLRNPPPRRWCIEPKVSIVVVVHNEGSRVERRLENLLALDYPWDRLEIVLASDGSTDDTVERARAYESTRVRVIAFGTRRGKPAVLNDVVPKVQGEIVVFVDARQRFEAEAIRALAGSLSDPEVGAVSGELMLDEHSEGTSVEQGVGLYWRYEKFIRWNESRVDSTVGATGAIYAIRSDLFEPIPEDTILDDVLIPMRIVRRGYRVLFEPGARAHDRAATTASEEFTRKVRTLAGNFQLFIREGWFLKPFVNRLWFQTVSHKGLRLLTPVLLVMMLGTSLLLWNDALYRWALVGQWLFYASAFVGYTLRSMGKRISILAVPYVVCLLSWATIVAFFRFVTGRQSVTWEKATV